MQMRLPVAVLFISRLQCFEECEDDQDALKIQHHHYLCIAIIQQFI